MRENPVWRESLEVYFGEGHGFAVYFYILIILAPVEFLSLYVPSLDTQQWSGSASLFKVSAVTALLLIVYFALRVANQEFVPWRFKPLKHWLREQGESAGEQCTAHPEDRATPDHCAGHEIAHHHSRGHREDNRGPQHAQRGLVGIDAVVA